MKQVTRKDCLCSVNEEERGSPCRSIWGCAETPKHRRQLGDPCAGSMSNFSQESRLQPLKNKSIRPLCLPVCLGMRHRCKIHSDTLACTETFESVRVKVCSVVSDYAVRHSESGDDVSDKLNGCGGVEFLDGLGFYPFCKLVDCHQQMCVASLACLEWSDCV